MVTVAEQSRHQLAKRRGYYKDEELKVVLNEQGYAVFAYLKETYSGQEINRLKIGCHFTYEGVANRSRVSKSVASRYIRQLVELGVVRELTPGGVWPPNTRCFGFKTEAVREAEALEKKEQAEANADMADKAATATCLLRRYGFDPLPTYDNSRVALSVDEMLELLRQLGWARSK